MVNNRLSPHQRAKRVGDQVQRELSDILRQLRDPRLSTVTVMGVDVSRDLSLAKVYVASLSLESVDKPALEAVLSGAAGAIRAELGERLSIYTTPRLQFIYDDSVEKGIRLTQLIDQANASASSDEENEDR